MFKNFNSKHYIVLLVMLFSFIWLLIHLLTLALNGVIFHTMNTLFDGGIIVLFLFMANSFGVYYYFTSKVFHLSTVEMPQLLKTLKKSVTHETISVLSRLSDDFKGYEKLLTFLRISNLIIIPITIFLFFTMGSIAIVLFEAFYLAGVSVLLYKLAKSSLKEVLRVQHSMTSTLK